MKRFCAILISLILMISSAVGVCAKDLNENPEFKFTKAEKSLLEYLEIVPEGFFDEELAAQVSRAEFVNMIAKLFNVKAGQYTDKSYFKDVEVDSVANDFAVLGVLKGTENGIFAPDDSIYLKDCLVIAIRALGYEKYYNVNNSNLLVVSRSIGLLENGIDFARTNEYITQAETIRLMLNILDCGILEVSGIAEDVLEYNNDRGSVMNLIHNIYRVRGIVTANRFSDIYGKSGLDLNQIKIDTTVYETSLDSAFELMGQNVEAYVLKNDLKSADTVVVLETNEEKNDQIEFDVKHLIEYKNYNISYSNDNGRKETINLPKNFVFVYNNVVAVGDYDIIFADIKKNTDGKISIYKRNGVYDTVVAQVYKNAELIGVDTSKLIWYTDRAEKNLKAISFEKKDDVYRKLYLEKSGMPVGYTIGQKGDLISVYTSQNAEYVKAYICTNTIVGTVDRINSDKKSVTIGGIDYKISKSIKATDIPNAGIAVEAVLDCSGQIARFVDIDTTMAKLGYMYDIGTESKAFENVVKVKIFLQDGTHTIYNLEKSFTLDGDKIESKDFPKNFAVGLISYKLNNNGNIKYIDTVAKKKADREKEGTLYSMTEGKQLLYYTDDKFFPKYDFYMDVPVFIVPPEGTVDFRDEQFKVTEAQLLSRNSYNRVFVPRLQYTVDIVKYDSSTPMADVIVYYLNDPAPMPTYYNHMLVVEKLKTYVAGEIVDTIYGFMNGNPVTLNFDEMCQDIQSVHEGDIIAVSMNAVDEISSYAKIVDFDAKTKNKNDRQFGFGEVISIENDDSKLSQTMITLDDKGYGALNITFDKDKVECLIYDSGSTGEKITKSSIDEIISKEANGGTDGDYIFYQIVGNVFDIIVYK